MSKNVSRPVSLEIYAIAKALEIALQVCRDADAEQRPGKVFIYSDCTDALEYFALLRVTLDELITVAYAEEHVGPAIVAAEELSALNIAVELRYVPGHAGIDGNMRADRAAKVGARLLPMGKRVEQSK